jgi:hypothetical protein
MIKKAKKYFRDLMLKVDRNYNHTQTTREEMHLIQRQLTSLEQKVHEYFLNLKSEQAATSKSISSIELELLMKRGACLDNNFEGKQDL